MDTLEEIPHFGDPAASKGEKIPRYCCDAGDKVPDNAGSLLLLLLLLLSLLLQSSSLEATHNNPSDTNPARISDRRQGRCVSKKDENKGNKRRTKRKKTEKELGVNARLGHRGAHQTRLAFLQTIPVSNYSASKCDVCIYIYPLQQPPKAEIHQICFAMLPNMHPIKLKPRSILQYLKSWYNTRILDYFLYTEDTCTIRCGTLDRGLLFLTFLTSPFWKTSNKCIKSHLRINSTHTAASLSSLLSVYVFLSLRMSCECICGQS